MSMQSLIMSRRSWATWFMSTMKPGFWERQGARKALALFRDVARRVPAYRKTLAERRIDPERIRSVEDFRSLPVIDKNSYLRRFPLEELCLDGTLHDKYLIDRSSGYSGASFFWPRLPTEDRDYPRYMKLAYEQFYQIDRKPTLMVITLALGTWVGGEKISWATREIAMRGKHPFTVITPGSNIEEILEIVDFFKGRYEQIVLVGYPPMVREILERGIETGIDWKRVGLKIGLGGEGYSEDWREYVRGLIGLGPKDLMGIAGGYGAADLGMSVGREYPISVLVRKLANRDKALARDLFGEEAIPSLCQYNPAAFHIEAVGGDLVFSCRAGVPLIRYNIHDRGGVIPFERLLEIVRSHGSDPIGLLAEYGYTTRDIWRLPFFYVYGRSDGTVIIDGTNVYPENVEPALSSEDWRLIRSHQLAVTQDQKYAEHFHVYLELREDAPWPGHRERAALETRLGERILTALCETNTDYRDAYQNNPATCRPLVRLFAYGEGPFQDSGRRIKRRYLADSP